MGVLSQTKFPTIAGQVFFSNDEGLIFDEKKLFWFKRLSYIFKTNSSLEPITVDFEKETIEEKNYQLSMCRILPKKSSGKHFEYCFTWIKLNEKIFFEVRLICRRFLQVNSYEETVGLNEKSHQLLLAYAVKKMYLESVDVRGNKRICK